MTTKQKLFYRIQKSESTTEWERTDLGYAVTSKFNEEDIDNDDIVGFAVTTSSEENTSSPSSFISYETICVVQVAAIMRKNQPLKVCLDPKRVPNCLNGAF